MLDLRSEVNSLVIWMRLGRMYESPLGRLRLDNCWLGSYGSVPSCEKEYQ